MVFRDNKEHDNAYHFCIYLTVFCVSFKIETYVDITLQLFFKLLAEAFSRAWKIRVAVIVLIHILG